MSDNILQEIACPNCRNAIDVRAHGQHVNCDACGSRFILRGHLCPQCSRYHAEETPFCGTCGTPLQRVCQSCQADNWAGDEYCHTCGKALDIFELLARQQQDARAEYVAQREEQIRTLREQEEAASRRRMAELEAEAAAYEQEIQRRAALQRAQDRRLLQLSLVAVAIFVVIVIAFTAASLL